MKRGNRAVRSQPAEMELAEILVLYLYISKHIRVHDEGGWGPTRAIEGDEQPSSPDRKINVTHLCNDERG